MGSVPLAGKLLVLPEANVPPKRHSLVVLCLFVVCTCGCSTSNVPVAVSLSPQTSTILFPGQSVAFTATDSPGDQDLDWDATSPVPIGSAGTFTAPQVTQNTNFAVGIESRQNPRAWATVMVTVLAPGQVAPPTTRRSRFTH